MMDKKHSTDSETQVPPVIEDKPTPGDQTRPLTPEEDLDHAVEETFPASDPISPSRIDTPST
ncbi:hypothetical protein ASG43_04730 [Aureimonas sp. Leaf454]|uniref:hypothetical protein n=1 Tax=Aureimonas sp. Leaf454 TaxID=1736381 RepID=UPI0006FA092E|nr:hypothetical protein [Aureimonas sp. Leaf454]KQT54853.1 hypothetical protein ASG43_04730 [Aureimonas sp. Leaf454]